MKGRHLTRYLLPILFVFSVSSKTLADDNIGRMLVAQCAQCHGTETNPEAGFERLAGKDYVDLYDNLMDRLFENEADDLMTHQTMGYTPEQIELIAQYLAALPSN